MIINWLIILIVDSCRHIYLLKHCQLIEWESLSLSLLLPPSFCLISESKFREIKWIKPVSYQTLYNLFFPVRKEKQKIISKKKEKNLHFQINQTISKQTLISFPHKLVQATLQFLRAKPFHLHKQYSQSRKDYKAKLL